MLAGASLDQGIAASSLIIWRQPAGSPGPAPGPGQTEARAGGGQAKPWGSRPLGPQPQAGHRWRPLPHARVSGWVEGYITSLLETLLALHCLQYRTHMPHHGIEGPSDASLGLPLQPHVHLFVDYSHGVCLAVLWKCQALIPLRFFADCSLLEKALVLWQSSTLTHSLGTRPCRVSILAQGAQRSNYLVPYLPLSKTELLREETC